jgi:hypothetical protein
VKGFRFPLLQRSCGPRVWTWRNHVVVGFRVERRPKVASGNLGLEDGVTFAERDCLFRDFDQKTCCNVGRGGANCAARPHSLNIISLA